MQYDVDFSIHHALTLRPAPLRPVRHNVFAKAPPATLQSADSETIGAGDLSTFCIQSLLFMVTHPSSRDDERTPAIIRISARRGLEILRNYQALEEKKLGRASRAALNTPRYGLLAPVAHCFDAACDGASRYASDPPPHLCCTAGSVALPTQSSAAVRPVRR